MKSFVKEYRVEIIAILIAALGIFLLVEQLEIRASIAGAFWWSVNTGRALLLATKSGLIAYITGFTASDLIGWILITATAVFVGWRARHRFLKSRYWLSTTCPKCGSLLRRIHRTTLDRILGKTLLPHATRYRCSGSNCGWTGLRHRKRRSQQKDMDLISQGDHF